MRPFTVYRTVPNFLSRTVIQYHGRTSSVPVKLQKRVRKDERKAMVESFVKKYRETNFGKFPSVSYAKKEVGGSYYVIRKIIQELKYKSTEPSLDLSNEILERKEVPLDLLSDKPKAVSNILVTESQDSCKDDPVRCEASEEDNLVERNSFIEIEETISSSMVTNTNIEESSRSEVVVSSKHTGNNLNSWLDKPIGSMKMENQAIEICDVDAEATDKHQRDFQQTEVQAGNFEHQQQFSVWNNLKFLADGIIKIWRKL